jgi:PAS domain S-box-containing protein
MKEDETRQQLLGELTALRQRLAELEGAEAERRQAEEALSRSEKRFRALIENSADAISLVDARGTVLYNSPSYSRLLGYSEEERRGRNTFELVHAGDRERLLGLFARILQKPEQVVVPPTRIRHADGSWHWIEGVASNLLAEPSVQAIVVNFRDITERRQAEEALRESEDKFKYVFDYSIVGKSITLPSGEISVNRAFCDMLGYTAEELQSQRWQDITHPDDIELTQRAIDPLLCGEKDSLRFVKRYLHKSGAVVWADASTSMRRDNDGQPLYFMTTVTDITERKRAEETLKEYSERLEEMVEERTGALREREQWLSTTLRSIGDGVIATDAQGVVTLMNPVAEELTGWDQTEAVGKPLEDVFCIVNEQTGEGVENPVARVLREGVVVGLANHTLLIARDGARRPIADSGAPMQDEAGKVIGTVMVFRDITAGRRAEEALERRMAELSALNAMASIVNESLEVDEILNRAMDEALRLVGVEAAAMLLLDEEAGALALIAHRGLSDEFVRAFGRMKLGEGLAGKVAQTGQPAIMGDLTEYPGALKAYVERERIRSAASVPLVGRTGVIGVMNLAAASSQYFDTAGMELLVALGKQIAIGVEKARLYKAVRQSQERLHYLVSSSPAVIYTSQPYGDYGGTFISENVAQQMGYEPQDFIEDPGFWAAHIHPEDAPRIFDGLPRLFEHGHHTHEYRFLCKDGTYRWMRDEMKLVRDADGEPAEIIGYWVDISERVRAEEELRQHRDHLEELVEQRTAELKRTNEELETEIAERKRAEESLRESEHLLRMVADNIPALVSYMDQDRRYRFVNQRYAENFRKPVADMIGKPYRDVVGEAYYQATLNNANAAFSGQHVSYETTIDLPEIGTRWLTVSYTPDVEEPCNVKGIFIAAYDITERKQAEEERVKAVSAVVDAMGDALVLHTLDGKITFVNPAYEKLTGYERSELVGRDVADVGAKVTKPEDAQKTVAAIETALAGEVPVPVPLTLISKEGREVPVAFTVSFMRDARGAPSTAVVVFKDITEIKRTEEELRRTLAELQDSRAAALNMMMDAEEARSTAEQANKDLRREVAERVRAEEELRAYRDQLEELVEERTRELREAQERLIRQEKLAVLGQLAGGVGHELRNPLGAIKNAAYYLNMAIEEPDAETREMLNVLEQEVDTSEKIIASLLDFARARPPTRRKVDLNDVVRETLSRTPLPDAPRVEVVLELDEDLPPILADPDQLSQVLGNIVRNGIQAMPGGGRLVIKSECRGDPGGRPEWVAVSVTDTGAGISEENLNKIFEPLFTTRAKGIGLGLAVVKTLVEGHGGTIGVESRVGAGSTFTVRLPLGVGAAVAGEGA